MGQPDSLEHQTAVAGPLRFDRFRLLWRGLLEPRRRISSASRQAPQRFVISDHKPLLWRSLSSRRPWNEAWRRMASAVHVGEFDLRNELRLDPVHPFARDALRQRDRRIRHVPEISSRLRSSDQLRGIEPGADAAGIAQFSLRIVIADEERAEAFPAAVGIGEADDHELLAIAAFDFEPAAAAARPVGLGPALRDDALELEAAGLAKEVRPAIDLMIAVAQHPLRLPRNDLGECGLAVLERRAGQVPAVAIKQIEGEEAQRIRLARWKSRPAVRRSSSCPPVPDERARRRSAPSSSGSSARRCASAGNLPVQSRPPRVISRTLPSLDAGEQTVAVVLDLVQPFRSLRRLVCQSRELRLQIVGHRGLCGRRGCPVERDLPATGGFLRYHPGSNARPSRDRRRSRRASGRSRR